MTDSWMDHLSRKVRIPAATFLISAVAGWGWGAKASLTPPRPRGNEATFVESYSSTEVTVQATGVGKEPADADKDVPLVAIQFILFRNQDKLVTTADEETRTAPLLDSIYGNPKRFITWSDDHVTSTRRTGDGFEITRKVRVNKGELVTLLERSGAVSTRKQLEAGMGRMTIMVVPDIPPGESALEVFATNPLAKLCEGAIESYLTQRQYSVTSLSRIKAIEGSRQMDDLKEGRDADLMNPASGVGSYGDADVQITFSGRVLNVPGGRKASLVVTATDATTGEGLGTENGYSTERPNAMDEALVEEATKDAIDKVLQRLNNYWKTSLAEGASYRIDFMYPSGFPAAKKQKITFMLNDFLRKAGYGSVKLNMKSNLDRFTLRAPLDRYPSSVDVMQSIIGGANIQGYDFIVHGEQAGRNLAFDVAPSSP